MISPIQVVVMAKYALKDVKIGDLIVSNGFQGVALGVNAPAWQSGGHLGLNPSRTGDDALLFYRRFTSAKPEQPGDFQPVDAGIWERGAQADYSPRETNPVLSSQLLEYAKRDIQAPLRREESGTMQARLTPDKVREVVGAIDALLQ